MCSNSFSHTPMPPGIPYARSPARIGKFGAHVKSKNCEKRYISHVCDINVTSANKKRFCFKALARQVAGDVYTKRFASNTNVLTLPLHVSIRVLKAMRLVHIGYAKLAIILADRGWHTGLVPIDCLPGRVSGLLFSPECRAL